MYVPKEKKNIIYIKHDRERKLLFSLGIYDI